MRKPDPAGPRLLLAGDTRDLAAIRDRLADAGPTATGLVLVEAFSAVQLVRIDAPAGVGVHWVFRSNARGTTAPRGEVLVRAVDVWLDEWMRAEGGVEISIWLGASTSPRVNAYARDLEHELAAAS